MRIQLRRCCSLFSVPNLAAAGFSPNPAALPLEPELVRALATCPLRARATAFLVALRGKIPCSGPDPASSKAQNERSRNHLVQKLRTKGPGHGFRALRLQRRSPYSDADETDLGWSTRLPLSIVDTDRKSTRLNS